jgi:hypothetical protein
MVPGLAMFYGGMVRAKNVLNTFFGCMACIGVVGIIWAAYGYATAFRVIPGPVDAKGVAMVDDKGVALPPNPSMFPTPDPSLIFLKGAGSIGSPENYGGILTSGDTIGAAPTGVPELAFFACGGPPSTTLDDLVRIAGTRWAIEECFELAKGDCGLDEYEVRSWIGWYRHVTLSLFALAAATVIRSRVVRMSIRKKGVRV